jgi:uncharacterized protein (DUF2267 family)
MIRSVDAVERSVHKTNEWLSQLSTELSTEDREYAWRALRSYLQLLRDQLAVDEAAHLAAQLTTILRGVFYDGFDPGHQPAKARHRDEFLEQFAERAVLSDRAETERAVEACTHVLRGHVTEGEFADVLAELPSELREALQRA